jgi:hypothetical protein
MPYWAAPEPYATLIERDPGRLRIALSHEWGPRHWSTKTAVSRTVRDWQPWIDTTLVRSEP